MEILECVPNFSEGRDPAKIKAIAAAISEVANVRLLHIDTSAAANRTVMTFAGPPEDVIEGAFQGIKTAAALIDMRRQDGIHPRIGATDVCPLVPLRNLSMEAAVGYADRLAERVGTVLDIPVYLYEHSARHDYRATLPSIRSGQYEGFAEKIRKEGWQPDYGPGIFNEQTGATVIGARDLLVAFNISLKTQDVKLAESIARKLRSSGYLEGGVRHPGILGELRAIGWYSADFGCAQVSMNLLDYRKTSPLRVFQACAALATESGTEIEGSELIGLMPKHCIIEAGQYHYLRQGREVPADTGILVHAGIRELKLDRVKPFNPQEKILEFALAAAGLGF